ncbi:MAG: DUF115 domain-containing protein [Leptospiraceae bacterium]
MEILPGPVGPELKIAGHSIHSSRAPLKEAHRFIDRLLEELASPSRSRESRPRGSLLLCGLGLGYVLDAFLTNTPALDSLCQSHTVYLYEPCRELRNSSRVGLEKKLEELLKRKDIHYLDSAVWQNPPSQFVVRILPTYQRHFPEIQASFQPDRNENTVQKLMPVWTRNFRIRSKEMHTFIRMPENSSFVFIGAAPALESAPFSWLRQYRRLYILLCSDTALGFCLTKGLIPDFVLSVDPSPATGYHLLQAEYAFSQSTEYPPGQLDENCKLLTYSAGPRYHRSLTVSEVLYESDFPAEQQKDWQCISNPVGNLAGLAVALAGSAAQNDLLLLGSDGGGTGLQSHCRSTGYEYFALGMQNRLNSLDTYFYRLARKGYAGDSRDLVSDLENAASQRELRVFQKAGPEWMQRIENRDRNGLPAQRTQALPSA